MQECEEKKYGNPICLSCLDEKECPTKQAPRWSWASVNGEMFYDPDFDDLGDKYTTLATLTA
jgi:hypothetical protein